MSEQESTEPGSHAGHLDDSEVTFLAAEALPEREARALMKHIEGCAACAERFDEAVAAIDGVREALLAHEAVPMPEAVWDRLEGAMATEVARSQRAVRPARPTPLQRTRRQAREADAAQRRSRLPAFLAAAAAFVVLVAGVGTVTSRLMSTAGSDSSVAGSSAQSPESARDAAEGSAGGASRAVVLTSGTNYTRAQVKAQAQALVEQAVQTSSVPKPSALASVPNARLADADALQECLTALYAQDLPPVAVDLATWEGREAAIIILPARDGGYEFWAVSRSCRQDNDGALYFTTLPAAASAGGSGTPAP